MSSAFYEWLKASIAGPREPKSVALIGLTYDNRIIYRLEFDCVAISEIRFPELDAVSKRGAALTVKLPPERALLRDFTTSGASLEKANLPPARRWTPRDFRLSIEGLERECRHVNRIQTLCVERPYVRIERAIGISDYPSYHIGNCGLTIWISTHAADGFVKWHEDVVIRGRSADKQKSGYLQFLDPSLGTAYFRVDWKDLEIFRMGQEKPSSGYEHEPAKFKVEMCYEKMDFSYSVGNASLG
jgi:hypothetical protein